MNSAFKAIREFHDMIGKNNIFRGWIALCAIISYGFSTVNRTISIDNLSDDRYYFIPRSQSGVLAGKRWGLYIYRFLLGSKTGITATDRIIAVVFAALAAYLLCTLFFTISEKEMSPCIYAVVASTFITYPLINEISEYPTLYSYIEIEFCAIIIAVLTNITNGKSVRARSIAFETCLLCIVTSGYESLVFAYITLVLLVLVIEAINAEERCSIKNILFEGVIYAIPLILAVIIKYAVGYLLVFIYDIHSAGMGATQILWNNGAEWAWTVIKTNIYLYFARGVLYFPVGVFVITSFVTFILLLINKKNKLLAIAFWLFALMSVFGQSVVQCSAMPYRTAQPIWIFVATNIFVVGLLIRRNCCKKETIFRVFIITMLFVTLRQSICLGELLYWNNLRSENEANLARQIGYRIVTEFDNTKPVIMVGSYYEGAWIDSAMTIREPSVLLKVDNRFRKLLDLPETDAERPVDTNVRSYLSWGVRATGIPDLEVLKWFFSYYGYDINFINSITGEQKTEFANISQEMNRFDIIEMDDYILVNLG